MKKIIVIILLTFIVSISFAQQYTPMTAAGYQMKRLKVDSTLHIPSFCGVPTTRNSTAKEGAVAIDTCNNLLYIWTNLSGWSSISGGTIIDTAAISAAIALRVKYTDTAGMLQPYLRKIDTLNKWVQSVTKLNDSTIRVVKNAITTDLLIRGNGVKYSDTAAMLSPYLKKIDTASLSNRINLKLNLSDTATMLSKYLRKTDTVSLSTRINLKLNLSDTATMLSKYLRKTDTASLSNRINLKLNISDTSAMLSKYLRKTDTASLSTRINTKLAISDTTNKWVQDVTKLNDSTIRVRKNNSNTDIILPKGSGGSGTIPTLQQVTDAGAISDHKITLIDPVLNLINTELNNLDLSTFFYKPLNSYWDGYGHIDITYSDNLNSYLWNPSLNMVGEDGNSQDVTKLKIGELFMQSSGNLPNTNDGVVSLRIKNGTNMPNLYFPISGNYPSEIGDTLATLYDVRNNAGSGSVTSVATGYGLSGGTITTSGTLIADTSVSGLSGKYVRITDTATMLLPYLFGSGTANYVPKFNTSRNLINSLIYDNATTVGINTSSPNASYKLDVNGAGRFVNDLYADQNLFLNNYFTINTTATTYPSGYLGIYRRKGNGYVTYFQEDEQGGSKDKWSFIQRTGYNGTRQWYQNNSSIVNINFGWQSPNSSNYQAATLLIDPTINITNALLTGTVVRGIYYNPTLTSLTNTKHIAFESTSGDIVMKGLKKSSSTTDSIAIWINDTLSKAPYPAGGSTVYVDSIYRTIGKDSIFYKKNGNTYAIKDSVGTNPAPVGYYGAFQDTTIQVAAAINTPYAMKLGVTDLTNAVTIVSDGSNLTRITIANTGIYNIQFSAQFDRTNSGTDVVDIWLRKNGVNVAGSGGKLLLTGGAVASAIIATWNYVLDVTAGDYYQLMWSTPDTHVRLLYETAQTSPFVHPLIPSLILTVTQQSGIMAGTGITAINSLTGAAQTMVVGTDSSDFKIASTGTSHTFNLPTASATKRGALSSTDWTTFNNKASGDTTSYYLLSDATTSNTTATNTNLTFSIAANTTYRIMIAGTASKATATTGMKLAIGAPTGCTIKAVQLSGQAVLSTAMTNSIISSINTLGATFATGIGVEVPFRIEGTITNGSTAGSITLQFASVTSNVATIYAGSVMQLTKAKGL